MADREDITRLEQLDTQKVSLVRRGANKRTFAVRKAEVAMEELLEQFVEIIKSTEAPLERGMAEETKKALGEKALNALKGAMRLINAYADEPGMKNVIAAMEAATKMAPGDEYPKPKAAQKKPEDEEEGKYPKPTKMAKEALEGMTPEQMQKVQAAIQKSHDAAAERIAKAEEQAAKDRAAFESERDLRLRREFVAKAEKEFGHLPGKPEELGVVLKSLHEKTPDEAAKLEAVLKSVEALIAKSELLREVGRPGEKSTPNDAMSEINKGADEMHAGNKQ